MMSHSRPFFHQDRSHGDQVEQAWRCRCVCAPGLSVGLCCARYLTGKRCQRIRRGEAVCSRPHQAAQEPGPLRLRRRPELCRPRRPESGKHKGRGCVCPAPSGPEENRHSGKEEEDGRGELLTAPPQTDTELTHGPALPVQTLLSKKVSV
ncbi:hypothetical protein INR49_018865, partial [Caranx melampygus]